MKNMVSVHNIIKLYLLLIYIFLSKQEDTEINYIEVLNSIKYPIILITNDNSYNILGADAVYIVDKDTNVKKSPVNPLQEYSFPYFIFKDISNNNYYLISNELNIRIYLNEAK